MNRNTKDCVVSPAGKESRKADDSHKTQKDPFAVFTNQLSLTTLRELYQPTFLSVHEKNP
jgi:hypothetical protein